MNVDKILDMINYEPSKVNGYYQVVTGYNYSNLYFYESKFFNKEFVRSLINEVHTNRHFATYCAIAYVLVIFTLKRVMRDREKFDLRGPLVAWNILLAGFSIFGTMRTIPETLYVIRSRGFEFTVCSPDDFLYGVAGHWGFMFMFSKFFELVDTLFIVLRKQPLIFLHWYHHATILFYCYYWYADPPSTARWFGIMNFCVHSIMYSYYACKAMRIAMPKMLSLIITTLQILQMIIGLSLVSFVCYIKFSTNRQCHTSMENLQHSFIMYFSYFILFFNFFVQAYVFNKRPATQRRQADVKKRD